MIKENGMNTVRVTPNFLMGEFLPACNGLLVERCGGKFAYALTKNYKSALALAEKIRLQRIEKMKEFTELDEKGEPKFNQKDPNAQHVPVWKDETSEKAYSEWENQFALKEEFEIAMYLVQEKELESITNCTPALLLVMEPMIAKTATLKTV